MIYLDAFDRALRKLDLPFVRYGDDIAIFLSSKEEAEATLATAARLLERMFMPLNREKTKVHHLGEGFKYLGEWFSWRKEKVRG
ncbi:MAG: reverse transcriptase domain-containing protein [candidate division KSB1 bacterium]